MPTKVRVTLIKEICWNLFPRRVHILATILLSRREYRLLSTNSIMSLALFIKAIKWFFFLFLNVETRVDSLKFTIVKPSLMNVA